MQEELDDIFDQDPDLNPHHDQDLEIKIMMVKEKIKEETKKQEKQRI